MYVGLTRVEDVLVVVPKDASVQHPSLAVSGAA